MPVEVEEGNILPRLTAGRKMVKAMIYMHIACTGSLSWSKLGNHAARGIVRIGGRILIICIIEPYQPGIDGVGRS